MTSCGMIVTDVVELLAASIIRVHAVNCSSGIRGLGKLMFCGYENSALLLKIILTLVVRNFTLTLIIRPHPIFSSCPASIFLLICGLLSVPTLSLYVYVYATLSPKTWRHSCKYKVLHIFHIVARRRRVVRFTLQPLYPRENSLLSKAFFSDSLTLEDGTDRLSRNVGNE